MDTWFNKCSLAIISIIKCLVEFWIGIEALQECDAGQPNLPTFFLLLLFLISFIDIKKEHPSTQGVYKGSTNQIQKLQESRKSIKEGIDCFCKAKTNPIKF